MTTISRHVARVLLVDDDAAFLTSLTVLLEDEAGYQVHTATSGRAALEVLEQQPGIQVVVSDLSMPDMDGIELLSAVREHHAGVMFILMTAHGSIDSAVQAIKLGAFQYLSKPVDPDELQTQVARALEVAQVSAAYHALKDRFGDPERSDVLVGSSPSMTALKQTITGLATVDSTVLIRGETGTGKELVARLIHSASPRAQRPLVVVNCTAIPRELLESELFGHERGAFTGATATRRGRIEEAEGGTLLLDEIGDMPSELQPKLLRFLQDRRLRRIGGSRERSSDIRILAATHRDLEAAMNEGEFREDLFYRLNTIPIVVPPLRERLEDLAELCAHLIYKISLRLRRPAAAVSPQALEQLGHHSFPGNVRELENLLERALVLGTAMGTLTDRIEAAHLMLESRQASASPTKVPIEGGLRELDRLYNEAQAELIRRAITTWGALSNHEIAERLGTNRRVLELRMKEHGISKRAG